MVKSVNVVFLAVKPQDLDAAMAGIADAVRSDHLVISIAAGKQLEQMESMLPEARVVRVMPNLPAVVSEGMSVFCTGRRVSDEDRHAVGRLLSCFGKVLELPEAQFDAVTALSGSGPAFLAHFLDLMVEGAVKLGLAEKDAYVLAEQTMLGTATLLARGGYSTRELIEAVSSKKGTTVAGLAVLTGEPIGDTVARTLAAAAERSRELSG
jgi:pyrroline-5-carboxylate reductase